MKATPDKPIAVIDTRIAYQNPWLTVREDKTVRMSGAEGIYSVIEVPDSVVIIAVNASKEICLVDSYRHPFEAWFWELPGGGGDGQDPVQAAARELYEEAGITANEGVVLGRLRVCNGLMTEHQVVVLMTDVVVHEHVEREDETRGRKFVSLDDIDAMVARGELGDGQSLSSLYLYKNWLAKQL